MYTSKTGDYSTNFIEKITISTSQTLFAILFMGCKTLSWKFDAQDAATYLKMYIQSGQTL